YLPQVKEETTQERQRILSKWQEKGGELVKALTKWSEKDLDNLMLPHPLLGNMTVREMLFFTLYHNMHHVNDVQRLLNLETTEWFES
ncbi:MAG: DinB family protein, partial [Chloroflexi bacterium]|nr:DinB family protein [Chloroflexota bacterium]